MKESVSKKNTIIESPNKEEKEAGHTLVSSGLIHEEFGKQRQRLHSCLKRLAVAFTKRVTYAENVFNFAHVAPVDKQSIQQLS